MKVIKLDFGGYRLPCGHVFKTKAEIEAYKLGLQVAAGSASAAIDVAVSNCEVVTNDK